MQSDLTYDKAQLWEFASLVSHAAFKKLGNSSNHSTYIIKPTSLENGLTSDGYLPVGDFVAVNDQYMIKPGLYVGTPEQIIVDLVPIL